MVSGIDPSARNGSQLTQTKRANPISLASEWFKIRIWHSSDSRIDRAWSETDSVKLRRRAYIVLLAKRLHFSSREHVALPTPHPSDCWVPSYDPERSQPLLLAPRDSISLFFRSLLFGVSISSVKVYHNPFCSMGFCCCCCCCFLFHFVNSCRVFLASVLLMWQGLY